MVRPVRSVRLYTDDIKRGTYGVRPLSYRGNMATVNDDIRAAVRIELARRGESQAKLAARVDISPQYLSDVMRARAGNVPEVWQRILDELGLELVVQPRPSSE